MTPNESQEMVTLEAPAARSRAWVYPWIGLLFGVAVGILVGHPLAMLAYSIHSALMNGAPLDILGPLLHSFQFHMWPMMLLFAVFGAVTWGFIGFIFQRLQENRQHLDNLHQEFELQVATLRHHYKNLALGIHGFSTRSKHKLTILEEAFLRCAQEKCPTYESFRHEFEALGNSVNILEDAAQRLTHLLGQELLFLKALTSDALTTEPLDLYPFLIHCVQDLLGLRFREKKIKVELNGRHLAQGSEGSLIFHFEPYTMEVILQNILANAMRYGDRLDLRVEEAADRVRVTVRDNGPGLEVETLKNLLLLPADRRGEESTHLGLRVSIHLLEKCGGRLLASSRPGQGATFIIEVPKQFRVTS